MQFMLSRLHSIPRPALAAWLLFCVTWCVTAAAQAGHARAAALNRQFQNAVACYQHPEYDRARVILSGLLEQIPSSFELNELMGLVYAAQHQPARASAYLAKAVRLQPGSAEARMYWAASLTALHEDSRAESEFIRAVQLDPASYDANHNLGEFYVESGNLAASIPYLAKAQQIQPASLNKVTILL
jgi:predicted Zn-dependent protease